MAENGDDIPLINPEKLEDLISQYKFPLIFGVAGVMLLAASLMLLFKFRGENQEIVFTSSGASSSAARKIIVDVQGAVQTPGTFEFREGDRVSDALAGSGGLSAQADREWVNKNLNRAAKLIDGGKIYVPSINDQIDGKSKIQNPKTQNQQGESLLGVSIGKVNINSAGQKELEDLPGVGPVTAGKIISGRPYQTVEELKSKKTVGNAVFEKIKDQITI